MVVGGRSDSKEGVPKGAATRRYKCRTRPGEKKEKTGETPLPVKGQNASSSSAASMPPLPCLQLKRAKSVFGGKPTFKKR